SYTSSFSLTDSTTTVIYTLSLHDALPIYHLQLSIIPIPGAEYYRNPYLLWLQSFEPYPGVCPVDPWPDYFADPDPWRDRIVGIRSEEHTSELQSREKLVCRLLLEKKKT